MVCRPLTFRPDIGFHCASCLPNARECRHTVHGPLIGHHLHCAYWVSLSSVLLPCDTDDIWTRRVIYSVTNMLIGLNVLAELIGGSLFPGNALAMNMFKSYGSVTTARAITFAQDLKLGHYTKIPPRVMFFRHVPPLPPPPPQRQYSIGR